MKELPLKKKKNTLKYIFKRYYAMTNKEFIDYMYICGKLKDVKFDTNMEVFCNSNRDVWKYWVLIESILAPDYAILYTMKIILNNNLNDIEIRQLIENMRLLSRTIVISWHYICFKIEESIKEEGKKGINKITIYDTDKLPIIIDDEYLEIIWKETNNDYVDIIYEDKHYSNVRYIVIKSDTAYDIIKDDRICSEGLKIFFKKHDRFKHGQ